MEPKVSVVIPNLNGKELLKVCLRSLKAQTFKDFETIVVDNASTDGSVGFLHEKYPKVRVIENKKNEGFAKPVNQGILAAGGRYVALLNNDTEADRKWLEELVGVLDKRKEVDFCASKVLKFHDRTIIDSAGDGWSWEHLGGYNIGKFEEDGPKFSRPRFCFSACAAAAIYRKELFKDVGLFDEKFFAHFEDIDFAFRAQLVGHRCLYVPTAVVYHVGGETTKYKSLFHCLLVDRNKILVILKNFPSPLLRRHWRRVGSALLYPLNIKGILNQPAFVLHALKSRLQIFLWLPSLLKDRQRIQRNMVVSLKELEEILV